MLRSDVVALSMLSLLLARPGKERSKGSLGRVRSGSASVEPVASWTGMRVKLVQPSVSTLLLSTHGKALLPGLILLGLPSAVHMEAVLPLVATPPEWYGIP